MLQISEITKNYRDGDKVNNVLKPTSLSVNAGDFIAIVGPSGSGKSTLLTIMGGLQKPSSGNLYIKHKDIYTLSEKDRSNLRFNTIGFVLQGSNLIPFLKVREQFELKLKLNKMNKRDEKISEILNLLKIDAIANKYPEEISGGERQRVAIGLSILLDPSILLADEPTASLDSNKAFEVVDLLKRISRERNTAVVMVTHDPRMLKYCDQVYEMNDGVLTKNK